MTVPVRALGAVVGALCWAFSWSAAAAGSCTDLPKSRLEVLRVYGDTTKKAVLGIQEFAAIAERHKLVAAALKKHPLYIAPPTVVWSVSIEHRVIKQDGGFCPAPTKVTIHVGMNPREALMVREAAERACAREALVQHHYEHIDAADAALESGLPSTKTVVGAALAKAKATPAVTEDAAKANFESALKQAMDGVAAALTADVQGQEAGVDSPERLEALKTCPPIKRAVTDI